MNANLVSQNRSTCWGAPTSSEASEIVRKAFALLATPLGARPVHAALHDLGCAEADDPAWVNGSRLAGLGIAAHASTLFADLKDAEARQFHGFAALERLDDQLQCALDHHRALLTRQADFLVH